MPIPTPGILRVLNAQLQDLMSLALASSTQSTYSSAVKQFLNFCMEHGVKPLPVDRRKLVYFAVALRQSLSTSTIKVYLSAVGSLQRFKDLTHHNPQLKMVLWGTRQTNLDRTSHPRQPIMRAVLHRLLYQVRHSHKLHKHDKHMLTAAFLLAFFGFLRVSKFTILSRSRFNTQIHPAKASVSCKRKYYTFTIKASKTDQLQRGHKIYILRSHEKFCPYSAMQKYIGHFLHSPTVGAQPLFTFRDGSPLTRHSCLKHLRRCLHKAGYLPQDFNTHSFRTGAATSAAHSSLPVHQIKLLGRWKSKAYCRYIRSHHSAEVAAKTFATSSLRK